MFSIRFGSLMDIDKLIPMLAHGRLRGSFGSLMDIDKLIPMLAHGRLRGSFGSLMDIDKLIRSWPLRSRV